MVSNRQATRLWRLVRMELTLEVAAAKAGMDTKTARKYLRIAACRARCRKA